MNSSYFDTVSYECRIKSLQKKIDDFKSGEKYVRMTEIHRKNMHDMEYKIKSLETEIERSHRETVSVRNLWLDIFDDISKENEKKIRVLKAQLAEMENRAINSERQRDEALNKLTELRRKYAEISEALEECEDKNKKLLAQVNHNYENSSIPSSKAIARKKIQNSREVTGKKPGAQPGHPHHERKKQEPTKVVELPTPEWISSNPDYIKTNKTVSKQMISTVLTVEAVEYRASIYYNGKTKKYVHAEFPQGVIDDVNYDGSIKALLYLLNNDCAVSIDKCSKFLYDLSGGKLKISKGMINKLSKSFSDKTEDQIRDIFSNMLSAPVMHTDCTNANVNGKSTYVFICAVPSGNALYFAREKKGHEGVKGTVVEDYQGILVHDHEATFAKYGSKHQECLAHVQRYLKDSIENESSLEWNTQMRALIGETIHYRNSLGKDEPLDSSKTKEYEDKYAEIIEIADKEYTYEPPGKYYRDGYNLYKRMKEESEKYMLFLHDKRVPATNNLSERLLRNYKRKQTQATAFRSFENLIYLCNGMSMLYFMRNKDDTNVFEEVKKIFNK